MRVQFKFFTPDPFMLRIRFAIMLTAGLTACSREKPAPRPIDVPPPPAAITATGFGPLRTGMSIEEATVATGGTLNVPITTMPDQCEYASWSAAPRGVTVMFTGGTLVRIDVVEPGIPTPEGLEVGATVARADSLYASTAIRRPHKYTDGEYLILRPLAPADTIHRMVIEITDGKVVAYRIGLFPAVEFVEGCA